MSGVTADFTVNTTSNAEEILSKNVESAKTYEKEIKNLLKQTEALKTQEKSLVGSSAEVKSAREQIRSVNKALESDIGRLRLAQLKLNQAQKEGEKKAGGDKQGAKDPSRLMGALKAKLSPGLDKAKTQITKVLDAAKAAWEDKGKQLKEKIVEVGKSLKEASKKAADSIGMGGISKYLAMGAAGAALGLGILAGKASIAAFKMADAERSAALLREAFTGSAEQAQALNTWEIHLADSTGLARDRINQFSRSFSNAKLSNKEYTASLEAASIAQAAIGDGLSSKVEELTTRFSRRGVFTLGRFELDGTGLRTEEVAATLAKNTNISIQEAQRALVSGRLPLQRGAEALRDTIKAKFGKVVSEQASSLPALMTRAGDRLGASLGKLDASKINHSLEGALRLFDANTVSGKQMLKIIQGLLSGLGWIVDVGVEQWKFGLDAIAYAMAKIENTILGVRVQIKKGEGTIGGMAKAFTSVGDSISVAKSKLTEFFFLGGQVPKGISLGVKDGGGELSSAGGWMFDAISKAFKGAAGIHSPSREAAKEARWIPLGVAQGMDSGAPAVAAASSRLADVAVPKGAEGGQGRSTGGVVVNVSFQVGGAPSGGSGDWITPSARQDIIRVIREAVSEGVRA